MKCRLIIDALGPNPLYDPPNPSRNPGAFQAYSVPADVIVPAGKVLPEDQSGLAWIHCFPQSGAYIDPKTRKPTHGPDGPVLAEPADEECEAAVARHLPEWSLARHMSPEKGRVVLNELIAASKARQLANNPPREEPKSSEGTATGTL